MIKNWSIRKNLAPVISRINISYLLVLCFLLRMVFVFLTNPVGDDTIDGLDYHNHALTLLSGGDYPFHGSLPFVRPPLYPFFLTLVYSLFPHESFLTARIANTILDTAACFLFYKLILLIWNSDVTAKLASLVYVFNPLFIFFCVRVRVEALFGLLLVTGVLLLIKSYKENSQNLANYFVIGAIFGLICLCRSNATPFIALIPTWIFFSTSRHWKRGILLAVFWILGCLITIAPWSIRNYRTYNEPVFITDGFGFSFWISNTDLKLLDLNASNHEEYLAADKELWSRLGTNERAIGEYSIKQRESYYTNLGIDYIKGNFPTWIWLNILKFAEFWSPMARYDMQGTKAFFTLPFGLLTLAGMIFFLRQFFSTEFDRWIWILIFAVLMVATVTGVLMWSSIRYRVIMVDAFVIPFFINWLEKKYLTTNYER